MFQATCVHHQSQLKHQSDCSSRRVQRVVFSRVEGQHPFYRNFAIVGKFTDMSQLLLIASGYLVTKLILLMHQLVGISGGHPTSIVAMPSSTFEQTGRGWIYVYICKNWSLSFDFKGNIFLTEVNAEPKDKLLQTNS